MELEAKSGIASPPARPRRWLRRTLYLLVPVLVVLGLVYSGAASWASARLLSNYVTGISFAPEAGPSSHPAVAAAGPLDMRLGYHGLPQVVERLQARGFSITSQARISERFNWVAKRGLYPPYREKTQAGLRILGRNGSLISASRFPKHVYESFEAVPQPVAQTLLFLENRELLDERYPFRNPAIEWDRFVAAVANFAGGKILGGSGRFGASTLATQLEKLRHSPDGVTRSAGDKARQMASATLRSYVEGPRTSDVRRRILTDYLNSLPVGALPRYGEVIGLRDGMLVWFGLDADSADAQLGTAVSGRITPEAAKSYRAVLMLLLAQRRPSHYFQTDGGRAALVGLTDSHLRLMASEAVVPEALARAALGARLEIRSMPPAPPPTSFVERKAINAVRSHLVDLLGAPGVYQLDRFDLTVRTTIDSAAQRVTTDLIRQLADPSFVQASGLAGGRLLGEEDPRQVSYSFVLYEREPLGNAIRVQVDNLERPFDLNSGARLELGSTAKLRTLVTYLEILSAVHAELTDSLASDSASARRSGDPITLWARRYVSSHQGVALRQFLEAGLERRYSASPSETFFTGGGTHVFGNFDDTHDHETPTVLEGLRHSVNLVYVRLMRDVVRYYEQRLPDYDPGMLQDPANPARRKFLERFVDQEGRKLVGRYHRKHRNLSTDSSFTLLLGRRVTPQRYARLVLAVTPETSQEVLASAVAGRFPNDSLFTTEVQRIKRGFPSALGLADRAFLAGIDPLELWVVSELKTRPEISLSDLQSAGGEARQQAYAWLFRNTPAVRRAQDRALRVTLEREAFHPILAAWRNLGYPYQDVVPSLATSIGSSGDRPGALAELVGILIGDGIRRPVIRVEELHFGEGTPYETILRRDSVPGTRVMSSDVATVARMALADVVERGTASSLRGALRAADSSVVVIGGKTGTGQNEARTFGPGGRLISARTTSRTATFIFYIGDKFYGVATAYVEGPSAERFQFTSALPVRVVTLLLPRLRGLLLEESVSEAMTTVGKG